MMKHKLSIFVFLLSAALAPHAGMAQTPSAQAAAPRAPAPLDVKLIRDNVYWVPGGIGGNSGVIVGDKGVFVIDAKQTPDTAKDVIDKIWWGRHSRTGRIPGRCEDSRSCRHGFRPEGFGHEGCQKPGPSRQDAQRYHHGRS